MVTTGVQGGWKRNGDLPARSPEGRVAAADELVRQSNATPDMIKGKRPLVSMSVSLRDSTTMTNVVRHLKAFNGNSLLP